MWCMYDVEYVPGKLLCTDGLLSRAPTSTISMIEEDFASVVETHVNLIVNSLPATKDRLQDINNEQ